MGLRSEDIAAVGRRVAAYEDNALERLERPSVEERLAAVHRKEAAAILPRPRAAWSLRIGVALAACAAVIAGIVLRRPADPLTYQLAGAAGAVGRWVAADTAQIALDFSDGSRVDVTPGARARVTGLEARGAGVLLERGSLHVRVVPRRDNRWVVMGGPFEVHVVGTEFDVAWDERAEELSVSMIHGHVRIQGPCVDPGGRDLAAPAALRVTCASSARQSASPSASPAPEPAADARAADTAPIPSAAASAPIPSAAISAPSAAIPAPEAPVETWRARLAAGKLDEAFAEVELLGLDAVMERARASELVDLGSAARLAGKPGAAARLYEAARRRFPGSDAAATSAYHLGRMAFDGRGALGEASRWFGVYLAERPRGHLAPEALGRSMECAAKLGDRARARDLASRYLAAYPKGAHAALATTLAGGAD
ncbi:MAG: FecR domain-containing protein [Minicystis sp.]